MAQSEPETLAERLGRYPVERYPVQHATTQFHLGSALLHAGQVGPALPALTTARDLFALTGMRLEQAKATVMLGVALRTAGRLPQAASAFSAACAELVDLDSPAELAAASYNLGLVRQDAGDVPGASTAWTEARELFLSAGYPSHASAAARDHGAALLTEGDVAAAIPLLEQALSLAERAGDEPGTGAAANALGLAQLALQEPVAAASALRRALAAFPRGVRPGDHAMVQANLALAHEQAGDAARARLAAGKAVAVPSAAAPVRAQALQVLARLPGELSADLWTVLDDAAQESWVAVLREEVVRVADAPPAAAGELVRGLLDGLLARPGTSYDLAESLLVVVLELPPRPYALLVSAVVDACAGRPEQDGERLRAVLGSAMARFAMPQWSRLAASFNAAARDVGEPATWR